MQSAIQEWQPVSPHTVKVAGERLNFTRVRYQSAFTTKVPCFSLFLAGKKTLRIKFSLLKLATCFPLYRDLFILYVDKYGLPTSL